MSINEEARADLAAHAAATEARLSAAQVENDELRAELAALAAQLSDVYASTSWRLSAPVRLAGRQAGRLSRSVRGGRVGREAERLARLLAPGLMQRRGRRIAAPRPADGRTDSQSDPMLPAAEARQPEYLQSDPLLLAAEARRLEYRPTISILVTVYDTSPHYLRLAVDSVGAQAYPEWELILCDDGSTNAETRAALEEIAQLDPRIRVHYLGVNRGISTATNVALGMAQGEFVAMLDHDDELLPAALLEVAKALNADPTLDAVYTDQDKVEADGTVAHTFYKPDWSLEMFRGVMYVGHLLVVRRSLADDVGGFDPTFDSVQDFEFMLRLSEKTERIAHVPTILYHWRKIPGSVAFGGDEKRDIEPLQAAAVNAHLERCGIAAVARSNPSHAHRLLISPRPRTRFPLVSVVVRASGVEAHLEACCERILTKGSYPQREIIVTGGHISSELAQRLDAMGVVLEAPGASGSTAGLAGLERAGGALIVSMAGDMEVETPDWLEHLLFECELPRVGCVAPLILSSGGTVASAGLIFGGEAAVGPAMYGAQPGGDGYAGSLSCVREVSAVSGDCYAVTRAVLGDLGGLSPYLATDHYQAIDLSIRAFSGGLRNLCTPRVLVRHRGPALRDGPRDALDELLLADAWDPLIKKGDPFHRRNFGQVAPGYRV
jgi:GT2 family glycosyltransferase